MLLLVFVVLALVVSLLLHGQWSSLARIHLSHSYLVLVALAIQILIFSSWWAALPLSPWWKSLLYALSLFLLLFTVWRNRHVPGLLLLGVGLFLNTLVILANGGRMPASLEALQGAGIAESQAAFEAGRTANSAVMDASTPLWFLGDILYVPKSLPLANVFSIGDLVIALGAGWFVFANTRPTPEADPAAPAGEAAPLP